MRPQSSRFVDFAVRRNSKVHELVTSSGRRVRLFMVAGGALCWVLLVMWRLASLQIIDQERWQEWAVKQHLAEVKLASERGPVYDRRGRLLAVSVPAGSVYVRPAQVRDVPSTVQALAPLVELSQSEIRERLGRKSPFVWLDRQIPRARAQQIADLKLPGVGFVIESRRYYPFNHAASALIGKVGTDGVGLSGLELMYEHTLHGEHVSSTVRRDALGNLIQVSLTDPDDVDLPKGNALTLTIDSSLQLILDQELEQGRKDTRAQATMGVLIDAASGEILAMGQSPALNFNTARIAGKKDLRNLVVETVFEPGSTMKPLVAAAALDAHVVKAQDILDCGHGIMSVGRNTIKDVHPYDMLSLFDVVVRSSNIGMSRVGFKLGKERLHNALEQFGFGSAAPLRLPGATGGILRPARSWAVVDEATHSFGHGVAVTPLQIVRAISAVANGGILPELTVLANQPSSPSQRVISQKTAQQVREMLYAVVEDEHGTGSKAAIPGLRVGGKTGTAERVRDGGRGYEEGAYIASFVGFADGAPIGVPRTLSLIIVVDKPNADSIYGGTLAAPIFQRVMGRVMSSIATEAQLKPLTDSAGRFEAVRSNHATQPRAPAV